MKSILFLLILMTAGSPFSQVPTVNAYQRTFAIRYGKGQGTAFTIDWENRQYIVTAGHVMRGAGDTATIQIYHEKTWKPLAVRVFRSDSDSIDVAVLTSQIQLLPVFPLQPSSDGIAMGQDIYLLGFPRMLSTEQGTEFNRGFPVPFVKKGIVSAMIDRGRAGLVWYVDAHSLGGFSGGPAICSPKRDNNFQVIGVVFGHLLERDSLSGSLVQPDSLSGMSRDSILSVKGNAHIAAIHDISVVLEIIKRNPFGVPITE